MRRVLMVAAVMMVTMAAPASASYHVPLPPARVVHGTCPAQKDLKTAVVEACADTDAMVVYIGDDCDDFCVAHEYGHIFDARYMDDDRRARWAALIGRRLSDWDWQSTQQQDSFGFMSKAPVTEQFADAFALCAVGKRERDEDYTYVSTTGRSWFVGPYGRLPRAAVADVCWLATHR